MWRTSQERENKPLSAVLCGKTPHQSPQDTDRRQPAGVPGICPSAKAGDLYPWLQELTENSRTFLEGIAPDPETRDPCREPYSSSSYAACCLPGLGRKLHKCDNKGQIKTQTLANKQAGRGRGAGGGVEVPWSRGKEREKSIFKKIKIFVSLELRMKRNDQKALVSGIRRVTPRSQARTESSHKPGCVLASIPAHPRFLGQTNSWLGRYVWEA